VPAAKRGSRDGLRAVQASPILVPRPVRLSVDYDRNSTDAQRLAAIESKSVARQSVFDVSGKFAAYIYDVLLLIAVWIMLEILSGCAAYARAMYGVPEAEEERRDKQLLELVSNNEMLGAYFVEHRNEDRRKSLDECT
jgi:hypothetical protein